MAGPWERYATDAPTDGPWAKYAPPEEKRRTPREMRDPTEDMSGAQKFFAGVGKGMTDIVRGTGQLIGEGLDVVAPQRQTMSGLVTGQKPQALSARLGLPSRADIEESRRLEAPLMATGAGRAGAIGGALVPLSALALVPGANTVAGSAALGAGLGAVEPVGEGESRATNVALGGALGGGSAAALKGAGAVASKMLGKSEAKAATAASQQSVRDATIKAAQAEGYVIPPSVTGGGAGSKLTESLGGKAAIGQEASIRNQQVTNNIARREAGIAPSEPISEATLETARARLAEPYRQIAAISPRAAAALEGLKQARADAKVYWKHYNVAADPKSLQVAKAADAKAAQYERVIERQAPPGLVDQLRQARQALAKNFNVERALNVGSGDVDAAILGRMLDKGAPLSGGLETIGRFAQGFPKFARERPTGESAPGVNYLKPYLAGAMGVGGYEASQHFGFGPWGAAAATLPLLSGPARKLALSKIMQSAPQYKPGMSVRLADFATNNPTMRGLIPLSAVSQAQQQQ